MNQEKMAHLWTSATYPYHRYDPLPLHPNPDGNIHPLVRECVFFELGCFEPPQIFPGTPKSEKLLVASNQTSEKKNTGWTLAILRNQQQKESSKMKTGPSQMFVGKHLIWKTLEKMKNMLPFFAKKKQHFFPKFCQKILFKKLCPFFPTPPPQKKKNMIPKNTRRKNSPPTSTSTSTSIYRGQTPWSSQWSSLREIPRRLFGAPKNDSWGGKMCYR